MKTLVSFNILSRVAVVGGVLAAGTQAMAIDLQFLGSGQGRNLSISTNSGSSFKNVFGGELRMKEVANNFSFLGFCSDPVTTMSSSAYGTSFGGSDLLGSKGLRAGYLVNKYAPGIFALPSGSNRQDRAFALQVAVWEILLDNSPNDITNGTFRARDTSGNALSSGLTSLINGYLSDNGSGVAKYYASNLGSNGKPLSQGVLAPVPEPATMLALGAGLVAFARKRRNKK